MRINHNIPALRALHQMGRTNTSLDKTLERLSSGLRINHASDDAAGLAISQKMDTQVRGLKQANRNAMDGISLIQTAEGALNEVHSMLQRIRELAIQSSNGTFSAKDRKAVNDEVVQLKDEIQRISDHIEFNEMTLLNGNIDRRAFSSDEDVADIVSMSDTVPAGKYTFEVKSVANKTKLEGKEVNLFDNKSGLAVKEGILNINGEQIEIKQGESTQDVFAKIRNLCDTVGLDISTNSNVPFGNSTKIKLTERNYGNLGIGISGNKELIEALGIEAGQSTITPGNDVKVDIGTLKNFPSGTTVKTEGNRITFEASNNFSLIFENNTQNGEVTANLLETGPLDLQIGANEGQFMQIRIQNLSPEALGIEKMSLQTATASQKTITIVDNAIDQISSVRSKLGAYQNRLEHTVANLDVAAENMTASLSRIQDADMAAEMAEYTQKNIISQAGVSMLAQANQRPQQMLQLLQG